MASHTRSTSRSRDGSQTSPTSPSTRGALRLQTMSDHPLGSDPTDDLASWPLPPASSRLPSTPPLNYSRASPTTSDASPRRSPTLPPARRGVTFASVPSSLVGPDEGDLGSSSAYQSEEKHHPFSSVGSTGGMDAYSMGRGRKMSDGQIKGRAGARFSTFSLTPDSPPVKSAKQLDDRSTSPVSQSDISPRKARRKDVIQPTFSLLFSLTTRSSQLSILIPATFLSIGCGLIPPYMTELIGQTFGAFSTYTVTVANPTLTSDEIAAARALLLSSTRNFSLQFVGLAVGVMIASSLSVALWVINGERTIKALRLKVFRGVGARTLAWYDLGMGAQDLDEVDGVEEAAQGAGGLMGRFSKETDDVRIAASQTVGLVIQYFTSFIVCLVLSFYRNYKLTFVVLASIPVIVFIVAFTERLTGPLSEKDREYASKCSSRADRILGAITTVKAFNAEEKELSSFSSLARDAHAAYTKLHFVWGTRTGGTQFVLLSMFVQGFWFGSYLVRSGDSTAAAVNTCFWACLLASSYLQMCIPLLVTIEKGKTAMADLLELAREDPDVEDVVARPVSEVHSLVPSLGYGTKGMERITSIDITEPYAMDRSDGRSPDRPISPHPFLLRSPSSPPNLSAPPMSPIAATATAIAIAPRRGGPVARSLRKLRPDRFSGELSLQNVTFHYPSRPFPAPPALESVSLYLASNETTYIVGGSGSGKSTVGSLLLGLYSPDEGTIEVDEQSLEWIDREWLRGHVGCVSQGASVLFEGTLHDNVAIGVVGQIQADGKMRRMQDVTREEVVAACRGALMHEFVRDLPEGYDTVLSGEKGASLSGGQRQRLAIARAWLGDPTVLILDEATSALDATSRLLVSEAIKLWRKNKTTVIITHDLTPINAQDFVYVMTEGCVVEQGYREDLEANIGGAFHSLVHAQDVSDDDVSDDDGYESPSWDEDEIVEAEYVSARRPSLFAPVLFNHGSSLAFATHEFKRARHASAAYVERQEQRRRSSTSTNARRRSSVRPPLPTHRQSMMRRPSRAQMDVAPPVYDYSDFPGPDRRPSETYLALGRAAASATVRRTGGTRIKHQTMIDEEFYAKVGGAMKKDDVKIQLQLESMGPVDMTLRQLVGVYYPTIPNKLLFIFGLFLSILVGACTPIFSSLLAKLMSNLGNPNGGPLVIQTSLLILLLAAVDGTATFLKFWLLEKCASDWITSLRNRGLAAILRQDKAWFDKPDNATASLVHLLIKDSEDARALVGTVAGQLAVVVSMIFMGLTWAFATGWELTLVGLGLAPVFILATRAQSNLLAKFETKNKVLREDVSKRFHQSISNVRAIRSMSLETVFTEKFESSIDLAYRGGARAAPMGGFGFALGSSLTYIAEALMFYVGAVLIVDGRYTFSKMTEVFTLIIFSITFSAQIMTYLPAMVKGLRSAIDFNRLLELAADSPESEGRMTFPIDGHIVFEDVHFAYPQRPMAPILKGVSFEIRPGECVGIVGASGSGKSTITALLQRLYEPTGGAILLDGRPLERTDVKYLRDHIAIVSQHPTLFDMTIADNITYGMPPSSISQSAMIAAATAAQAHDFISSLPKGYSTLLGENASLISGGQAQRLQIARALIRPREILILDECTSALDASNQALVMDTIRSVKEGRTTLIVSHKLDVMRMCDRLVIVEEGRVVETGTVSELFAKGGVFASLARAGEWES